MHELIDYLSIEFKLRKEKNIAAIVMKPNAAVNVSKRKLLNMASRPSTSCQPEIEASAAVRSSPASFWDIGLFLSHSAIRTKFAPFFESYE